MSVAVLTPGASPLEAALESAVGTRIDALDPALVASSWNPDTCPAALLPYLAWNLSIDLWDPAWPELKQRQVCRDAFRLHALKTTPAGIRAHVALAGGAIETITRPPARTYLRGARTPDQQRAWLDSLPQVRIYPFVRRVTALSRGFLSGSAARRQHPRWVRVTRGKLLIGRRATLFQGGVETPLALTAIDAGVIERVALAGPPSKRSFVGTGFVGDLFAQPSRADGRIVTIRASKGAPSFAVPRTLEAVDVFPVRVSQTRTAPEARRFIGRDGGFLRQSFGPQLIYDRVSLHDVGTLGARRELVAFVGHTRLGMAPFSAELRIRVPMRRHARRAGRWCGGGFVSRTDLSGLARVVEAVRTAKAARDTILIETTTHGRAAFGGNLRFGEFEFGQIRKAH